MIVMFAAMRTSESCIILFCFFYGCTKLICMKSGLRVFVNCLFSCCQHLVVLAVALDPRESKMTAELLRLENGNIILL